MALRLGVTADTVRRRTRAGAIPAVHPTGTQSVRYRADVIEALTAAGSGWQPPRAA